MNKNFSFAYTAIRFLVISVALFTMSAMAQGWEYVEETDAFTDEVSKRVIIVSESGDIFSLSRREDERVWMYLALGGVSQFSPSQQELFIRIDKS